MNGPPTVWEEIREIWDEIRFTLSHIRDLPMYWRTRRDYDREVRRSL